ncbi:hypothetical protein G6F35_016912 [Rhizopus arrhizus]|nr:hypothetical protein G6F35_016912 [Rhizopus arrhizus]
MRADEGIDECRQRRPVHIGQDFIEGGAQAHAFSGDQALDGQAFHALGQDAAQQLQADGVARLAVDRLRGGSRGQREGGHGGRARAGAQQRGAGAQQRNGAHDRHIGEGHAALRGDVGSGAHVGSTCGREVGVRRVVAQVRQRLRGDFQRRVAEDGRHHDEAARACISASWRSSQIPTIEWPAATHAAA